MMQRLGKSSASAPRRLSRSRVRRLLLGVPIVIGVHNLEEALTMRAALPRLVEQMPPVLADILGVPTYASFLIALGIVTLFPWLLVPSLLRAPALGGAVYGLLVLQTTWLLNVLSHLGMAAALDGYAPGLGSAVALVLPFSVAILWCAVRDQWFSRWALVGLFPLAVALHGLVLPLLMRFASTLTGTA